MNRRIITAAIAVVAALATDSRAAELVLPASEDTAPYSFVPSLARYNADTLYAFVAEDENEIEHSFETYLRFPGLAGMIPEGEEVLSADLLVYYAFDFEGFGETSDLPATLHCHRITGSWNQTTLTWNTRPSLDGPPLDTASGIEDFGIQSFDVTAAAAGWASGSLPDHGLALVSPTPRVLGMHSSEASVPSFFKATLVVETGVVTPVPAVSPPTLAFLAVCLAACGGIAGRKRARR